MADFFQTGAVATLHHLKPNETPRLEQELEAYASTAAIGLALPALFTEFEHPAMRGIVMQLRQHRYLRRIVVALGRADAAQYRIARAFFDGMETPVTFLQVDHERILRLFHLLEEKGLPMYGAGKGRTCWLAAGYLLARGDTDVIAFHDCDIRNYDGGLLARLCYPLAHPGLGFEYAKGYYARVSDQLHGRVTRLFFTPLVRALRALAPGEPYLEYLDSFRYALSGEFAMRAPLARQCRMQADWGLEIGMLAEAFDHCGTSRICQVDIADNYDHKHQRLSADDASGGLRRMSLDIAQGVLRSAAAHGLALGSSELRSLQIRYCQFARDAIRGYEADAICNGLLYNRHAEETTVQAFSRSLTEAAAAVCDQPLGGDQLPSWGRVLAAVPEFFELLLDAVAETDPLRPVLVPGWEEPPAVAQAVAAGLRPLAFPERLRHQLQ